MKPVKHLIIICAALLLSACSTPDIDKHPTLKPPSKSQIKTSVKDQIDLTLNTFTTVAGQILPNNNVLKAYQARNYKPIWINNKTINPSLYKLVDILKESYTQGLNPIYYHTGILKEYLALKTPTSQQLAEMDVIATMALSSYAHDLSNGRYKPQRIDPNWQLDTPNNDWKKLLYLNSATTMVNSLPSLVPHSPQYHTLQKWLVYYQQLARTEKDILVTPGTPLSLGDQGPRVAQLRARLTQLGGLRFATQNINETKFDQNINRSLKNFQSRHHIKADGSAGSTTIKMLNVPLKIRAKEIAYNLERWRWLPSTLETNRIWVDLTNYTLDMHLNGEHTRMKIIIGKPSRKTPVFKGLMTYMVTNPAWHVPYRIARENLLPKLKQNPNYLVKHGYKVYKNWDIGAKELNPNKINWKAISENKLAYRFEQKPGKNNALGQFKFMFPNKNAIYLHDTPHKYLFRKTKRAFSSGCIRLEKPMQFAKALTKGSKQETKMLNTLKSKIPTVTTLPTYIPVYLVYFTVVPSANGMLEFRDDIYNRDTLMGKAMDYKAVRANDPL